MEIVKRDLILHNYTTRCYGILLGRASYLGFGPVAACFMTQQKYCDIFLRGLLLANGTSRPSHMKIIGVIAEHRGLNIYGKEVKWSEVTSYIDLRTLGWTRMRRLWGCLWSDEGNGRRCASRPFHERIWKMWRSLSPHKTCAFAPPVEKTTKKAPKQQNPTVWNVGSFRWESAGVF